MDVCGDLHGLRAAVEVDVNAPESVHIDPLLAEVFELLHRMELCQTREPFQWMARDAIRKLERYEGQQKALLGLTKGK